MTPKRNNQTKIRTHRSYSQIVQNLLLILATIREGSFPTKADLAKLINVTPRTIQTYLKALRDLGAPIEFDRDRNGHYLRDKRWRLDR
jgi:predicted DNA-binding transcriptional regulator YafY